MLELRTREATFSGFQRDSEPFIAALTTNPLLPAIVAKKHVLLLDSTNGADEAQKCRYRAVVTKDGSCEERVPCVGLPEQYGYLAMGDVVRVNPRAHEFNVLYRRFSPTNSLLVTERCNSFCVMCSQPPRDIDDSHLASEVRQVIELMDRGTESLGITGGEPALLGDEFLKIVRHARNYLPDTKLHVLTNGRLFEDLEFAKSLAALKHPNLVLGIPLYSDQPDHHDFVVQANNAFDETIKGILNLKAMGIAIELRVVIHHKTYARLPELARFISRNLTFVDYVALMGLELVGFAKSNMNALWMDPYDYQKEILSAVRILKRTNVPVLVYNHQLCVVPEEVRPHCVKSISDWKNDYLEVCEQCTLKSECGGFFSTGKSLENVSAYITPL